MSDEIDLSLLARYFAFDCTGEERLTLEHWIDAEPARRELVAQLRAAWDRASQPGPQVDVERAWEAVVRRKAARALFSSSRRLFVQVGGRSRRGQWWSAVAGLAAASIVGWLAVRQSPPPPPVLPAHGPVRTARTQPGQRAEIYLADGTQVRLGASSTLRFPTTFGAARRVFLEGEAYFDVVHDDTRPFAVRTSSAVVRDLGTKFVILEERTSGTEVVVAEGAVVLMAPSDAGTSESAADSLVLMEADLGRVDRAGRLTLARQVDVSAYLAWMDGQLVFIDTPLSQALPRLARWYGVDFKMSDPALGTIRLTAKFDGTSLKDALRQLAAVLDVEVEQRGRTVVLKPKRRGP